MPRSGKFDNNGSVIRLAEKELELSSLYGDDAATLKKRKKLEQEIHKIQLKLDKERREKDKEERIKAAEEEGKILNDTQRNIREELENWKNDFSGQLIKTVGVITDQLDPIIENYVKNIQVLSAHLEGTGRTYSGITDNLQKALSGQGLVNQQKVVNNLTDYVKSGIVYNVEQRAFLRTIADDIDLVFDGWTNSMNQLVRIQRQDSTANRLALEYSLQTFLNENYQTSEYIKNSFASVSESLITSQSTMTAQNAMAYEATIQSWLGSLYSAGANQSTVSSLAKAIDQLGSGDISGLGSGISNLVLMGAARAGLDYGAILNQGLNASTTDKLLAGITSYMSEQSGRESNVVRSQIGKLFGVGITDLIAASNVGNSSGNISTDISGLLGNYSNFTPYTKQFNTLLENMMYTWGTNIASNPLAYYSYEVEKLVSNTLGKALEGTSIGLGIPGFAEASIDIGKVIQAAPLLTLIPTLFDSLVDVGASISSGSGGGLTGIFNSLSSAVEGTTVKISDMGVSGSAYLGSGASSDLLNSSINSLNSTLAESQVITQEGPTQEENVSTITDNVQLIVELLQDHLVAIDNQLTLMGGVSTMAYTYAHDQGVSF